MTTQNDTPAVAWRYLDDGVDAVPVLEVKTAQAPESVTVIAGAPAGRLFLLIRGKGAARLLRSWSEAHEAVRQITGVDLGREIFC